MARGKWDIACPNCDSLHVVGQGGGCIDTDTHSGTYSLYRCIRCKHEWRSEALFKNEPPEDRPPYDPHDMTYHY
jgi:hypothetical protein